MKSKILSNLIWRFMERFGAKAISFLVQIVLARLLLPEDYGTVSLILVFINILDVFIDSGMGSALIQKEHADNKDFSTVFFFNMGMCTVLYIILFLTAPFLAAFYDNPDMTPMIRVVGIILLISGLKNVQQSYISRNMLFKKFFFSTLGGTIASAAVGIAMACAGMGAWALIGQKLTNACIDTLILWITVRWRPIRYFSFDKLKRMFSFGWKLLVSSLLNTIYGDLRQLVIGKKYTKTDLAYYNQGQKIPSMIADNLNASIGSVLFPALAREQSRPELVKAHVRRSIQISSYLLWPAMFGIMACAKPLVSVLLTDKWMPAVPFLQIACFTYGFFPIHTTNLQAINALGRSDLFLKLEIQKKVLGLAVLLLAIPHGVMAIAVSAVFTTLASTVINAWPNRTLLHYQYFEQIRDLLPAFLLSGGMCLLVMQVERLGLSALITLCIQIPLGILIYLGGSVIFHLESYHYILGTVKQMLKKRKEQKKAD